VGETSRELKTHYVGEQTEKKKGQCTGQITYSFRCRGKTGGEKQTKGGAGPKGSDNED